MKNFKVTSGKIYVGDDGECNIEGLGDIFINMIVNNVSIPSMFCNILIEIYIF